MNEPYDINTDITNIRLKIVDIESDVKDNTYTINTIKETQTELAKETVEIIEIMANKSDENQINTMKAIDELKKSQKKWWRNLHWVIKLIIILFIISYIIGSYFAIARP